MIVTLELSPDREIALKAAAQAQGLSIQQWLENIIDERLQRQLSMEIVQQKKRAAAARILDIRTRTKPDPEGWTIKDYIDYGRR